ncbi:MAG: flagellar motor stator protein MotA [Salinarimonadaceae bacterium]|nr:MAG: flagellar motor stator protein MotA [Salinarimonadaceae bacterium]
MAIVIGLVITIGSLLGGFSAMGGHVLVIWQPWEFVIIGGTALGTFIIANSMKTVRDTGGACVEACLGKIPRSRDYLDLLGLLYMLMRDIRAKGRNDVEPHIDDPLNSEIFRRFPRVLVRPELMQFVCDYVRLLVIGNARSHEIESLMDEEIDTMRRERMKPFNAMMILAEALPALGIVAAVLGVIKAMGALDQSPQLLGSLIGAALVGTFAGIFLSYGVVAPLAYKVKSTREHQMRLFVIAKQTILAFMNGALPQIALEHGRKAIASGDRPSIDEVESETISASARPANDRAPVQGAA